MASGLGWLRFACTRCGECCRRLRVPVTGADLARLTAATGAPPESFVEWASTGEVDLTGEPGSLVLLPEGPRVLLLAQQRGACVFLGADGLCTQHAARPIACRVYPFDASFGRRGGVRRLRLLDETCRDYALDGRVDRAELGRDVSALSRELVRHQARVEEWNRTQRRRRRFGRALAGAAEFLALILAQPPSSLSKPQTPTASA